VGATVTFRDQLLELLHERNAQRPGLTVTLEECVRDGLGLHEVYAGKIRHEGYVPAYQRIAQLAAFLAVPPTRFDAFVQQYAQRAVGDNHWWENDTVEADPVVMEVFRIIAAQSPRTQEYLKGVMLEAVRQAVADTKRGRIHTAQSDAAVQSDSA
jgi:hypothetical protein